MEKLIVKQFSELLLELGIEAGTVNQMYESYSAVVDSLEDSELQRVLDSPKLKKSKKKELLSEIIGDVNPLLKNFIYVCVDTNVTKYYGDIYRSFEKRVWKYQGKLEAVVYSVEALSEREMYEVRSRFEKKVNKEIILTNKIDKTLISGIRLECEDLIMDNSIDKKIDQLASKLKGEV